MTVLRRSTVCAVATLVLAACGGEGGSSDGYAAFCAEVLPRVEAYLEQARADHPTPDDERYGGTVVVGAIGELPRA